MTMEEINAKKDPQLKELIVELKKEQMNLRFQKSAGELTNTARFREVRRTIARIHTVINQRKHAA